MRKLVIILFEQTANLGAETETLAEARNGFHFHKSCVMISLYKTLEHNHFFEIQKSLLLMK